MATVTIIGAGMMGSALAFPARENGHEVRLVGTHLDRDIIETAHKTGRHPKFTRDFPRGVKYYTVEQMETAISGADMIIGGVSSFGVSWFGDQVLPKIPDGVPVISVTKGLYDMLIAMDGSNLRGIERICGGDPEGKVSLLLDHTDRPGSVADPWYTGNFDETWDDVCRGCAALLEKL